MIKKSRLHEAAKMVIAELEADGYIVGKTAGPWHLLAINRLFPFPRLIRLSFNGWPGPQDMKALNDDVQVLELTYMEFWTYRFDDGVPGYRKEKLTIDRKRKRRRLNPGWDDEASSVSGVTNTPGK